MLQARLTKEDPRFYNPSRDIAHCFPQVATAVAQRMEAGRWPELAAYLKQQKVTDEDLGAACEVFIRFVQHAVEYPKETMQECMVRCGWDKVPEPAKIAYAAYLGTVMTGMFFVGVREATIGGHGPCDNTEYLVAAAVEASRLMTMSRPRRYAHKAMRRIKGLFNGRKGQ